MITGIIGCALGVIYIRITLDTIRARHKHKLAYGYGENNEIAGIVSTHSNFAAYMPFALVLMLVLELMALHAETLFATSNFDLSSNAYMIMFIKLFLWLVGACFLLGRVFHYKGLSKHEKDGRFAMRKLGMHLTLWPFIALLIVVGGFSVLTL